MRYNYSDGSSISPLLVKNIRKLHEIVGNAITNERYIVFGSGSTQLINAAVYALSHKSSLLDPAKVLNTSPYCPLFRKQTEFFNSRYYTYEGDTRPWKKKLHNMTSRFIEFVVSPNNPDGLLTKAVLKGPNVKTIHDLVYYWPHFTPIPSPADEDLMIFSNSKLTGHGSNRFGEG
nr:tryptophan aminotransferase-related protein 4 [Arachis hypogaea]